MTITAKFIKAFDSKNKAHVMWLSHMIDLAQRLMLTLATLFIKSAEKLNNFKKVKVIELMLISN